MADMGCGSGTYTVAAFIRRRKMLALDFDVSQQAGFYLRISKVQNAVWREHAKLLNSQQHKKHYRENVERWKFYCDTDVNSLKEATRA